MAHQDESNSTDYCSVQVERTEQAKYSVIDDSQHCYALREEQRADTWFHVKSDD